MSEFKVGDKVRLKTVNADNHPEAFRGVMTVDSLSPALDGRVGVQGKGRVGAFFPAELERGGFRVGDRVVSPGYSYSRIWGGELVVDRVYEDGAISCKNVNDIKGIFSADELRFAPEAVAVEQEPEAQPVTYRICVDNKIGTTEYPSQAAAEQAAILHGKDGETFSIWETVMVADYRVKVTKSVEIV
jgi:hypothetical protein